MGHLPIDFALSKETCRFCGHQLLHDVSIEVPGTDTLWNLGNFAKTEISLKHTIFYPLLMVVYHVYIYIYICTYMIMYSIYITHVHITSTYWDIANTRQTEHDNRFVLENPKKVSQQETPHSVGK